MDTQRRKELAKEKLIERLIRKEEYEEAMNKLPINERAIIKEVLIKIKSDNHKMFIDELTRECNEMMSEFRRERERRENEKVNESFARLMRTLGACAGGIAFFGLVIITR